MADIIDPQVKRYLTAFVRPSSNNLVGLSAAIDIELQTWFSTVSPILSAFENDDVVVDDSQVDGTAPLTKADIVNYVTQLLALQTAWAVSGVMPVISKPHYDIKLP